ncbi:hypothetical protein M501DRAFT_998881 [Patellaria atrata CBS 101060]|uniref:Uncharacterized protein n=1 Tax=Patellaria atrata CBS 101060 TaxID=1346257 RepID=A0A9P4VR41_9PEZI|nr:hypothetical protein M501DRAFT_998881 [Patellaria atrata CBS 101060]
MGNQGIVLRPKQKAICQICDQFLASRKTLQRRFLCSTSILRVPVTASAASNKRTPIIHKLSRSTRKPDLPATTPSPSALSSIPASKPSAFEAASIISKVEDHVKKFLGSEKIPTEEDTLTALLLCEEAARRLTGQTGRQDTKGEISSSEDKTSTPTSALLSLDKPLTASESKSFDFLETIAYRIVVHPSVFITPKILYEYLTIQSLLRRPSTLPEILDLYHTKPAPRPSKKPTKDSAPEIKYTTPSPNAAASAVPPPIANAALDLAIATKSLPTALSIITLTFAHPSFRRSKIIKRLFPPFALFLLTPPVIYLAASQFAVQQTTMSPSLFTGIVTSATLAYVIATAGVGVVAVATANDQMKRVTWALGMPLRERWMREEEREALDRIACAWGFRQKGRWGEEEGEEWEELREWIGLRGMVLDKVSLMEGME